MTSTPEEIERSPLDEATIEVMGNEIVDLTNDKLNVKVELRLTQKRLQQVAEECAKLNEDNQRLSRENGTFRQAQEEGKEQNRRLLADNELLRQRISELTRPSDLVGAQGHPGDDPVECGEDCGPHDFRDPADGPLIDTV